MGRGPFFCIEDIPKKEISPASDALKLLQIGDIVKFKIIGDRFFHRCTSIYDKEPSTPPIKNDMVYKITDINTECMRSLGLNIIYLIDINHPNPDNHIDGWCVTTDGYIRETEHYTIMFCIESVEKMQ